MTGKHDWIQSLRAIDYNLRLGIGLPVNKDLARAKSGAEKTQSRPICPAREATFSTYTKVSHQVPSEEALRRSVVELPLTGVRLLGPVRHFLLLGSYYKYIEYRAV